MINFLNKIGSWILNNYIKAIIFFLITMLTSGIYFYFDFLAQKKDKESGDLFQDFYTSYKSSDFNEEEYKDTLDKIFQIDSSSIYLVMLKSIYAVDLVENNDLQKALIELSNAKEILSNKNNNFNFLKEIIDLRMVNILISLGDTERAKILLESTFTTYQANKLILQGDILAKDKNYTEAKQKYTEAMKLSVNDTQKNLINLKISTLTD